MTGRVCAAKCLGYLLAIQKYYDLIVSCAIENDEAIDAFIEMNAENEARFRQWHEDYVRPLEEAGL